MSDQTTFIDPLDDLFNRVGAADNETNDTTPESAPQSNDQDDDVFGKNDLMNEIAEEEAADAAAREAKRAELEASKQPDTTVVMPPNSLDKEYQREAIDFQANTLAIVSRMLDKVLEKHGLTSGEIPVSTQADPDLRRHVMGDLIEQYHLNGEEITPEFEDIVLRNWVTSAPVTDDADESNDEPQPEAATVPDAATINIQVKEGTPVTVNVDQEVVRSMSTTKQVDIVVTEVSEQELKSAKIVQNSMRDDVIQPYESDVYDVPITLPLSGYRCVLKPINYYEFIQLGSSPMSGNRVDQDKKQWSIIYDHIKNVSIGEFKDFEDFLKKTKYADRELLMWGVLIASTEEEERITVECQNKKCKRHHEITYNPRTIIHVNDDLIRKYDYETTHTVPAGEAAIAHFDKINSTTKRYKLPKSGFIVEINDRGSAYDFLNYTYPLMDRLRKRFTPTPDMIPEGLTPEETNEFINDSLSNNGEYAYLMAHALYITAISIMKDDHEYRYTNWDDIEHIITSALDMNDAAILLQLVQQVGAANVSPMQFYLDGYVCEGCGNVIKRIPIPDIGDTLIFQLTQRLSSTKINLIEMESN